VSIKVRRISVESNESLMTVRAGPPPAQTIASTQPPQPAPEKDVAAQQQPTQDQSYQKNLPQGQPSKVQGDSSLAPLPPGEKQDPAIEGMVTKLKGIGMQISQTGTVYTLGFIKSGVFPQLKTFLAQNNFQVALDENKQPYVRSGWNYWQNGSVVVGYKAGQNGKFTFGLTTFLYKDLYI